MSFAWLPVDVAIVNNHKTKRLVRRLGLHSAAEAVGYLVCLWAWAMVHAPDGDLSHLDVEDIAGAAGWPDDPEHFVKALHGSKWLDKTPGGYVIHQWEEHQGQSFRKRVWEADRKRRQRDSGGTAVGHQRDTGGTSDTDQTGQDKTIRRGERSARAREPVDNSNGQPARPTTTLLEFTVGELPTSNSTSEDYARTLARHESRLPRWHIERIVCELAEWRPAKPPARLHLTLNKWLAKEKPEPTPESGGLPADPDLVRPDMVETFAHMVTTDGARLEDLRRSCVSEREYEAVAARVAGIVAGSEGVHW